MRLGQDVSVYLPSGYHRTLRKQTTWKRVGTIEEGGVWEPVDTVLTVEGRYLHEAYLVVDDGRLVGFYMPVEDAFMPLRKGIPLEFATR